MSNAELGRASAQLKEAVARRDRGATNRLVTALLDGAAPLGVQWRAVAELMRVSGELALAHRAMDAFVAAAGHSPQARYGKVVLLTQSGRQREAYDLLSALPPDVPDPAGHAYVLGNTAITLGRLEEGQRLLQTALDHRPGWGAAWLTLATATRLAGGSPTARSLADRLLADRETAARQPPEDRARFQYALGKLHADRGEHAQCFAAFREGATLLRSQTRYSREGNAANARAAMSGWTDDLPPSRAANTNRPIFVTGLPRSGTTLVEQILASHSQVADGGELNIVQHLAVAAGGVSGDDLRRHVAAGGSPGALGELYLHLLAQRYPATGRIVDKTIDASRFLGLIAAALPDAPLIWMRRDPLDSAWSCLRTFFIHGVAWSYDLTDIAHHFRLEDALLAFWKDRLGDRLLVVPYAELVEDPAAWTARLLAHCGLAEEAAPYMPHLTERGVVTASSLQVRRPINRDGLGVAEPYRANLAAFTEAYEAYEALG